MIDEIVAAFRQGAIVPYLGPGVTGLLGEKAPPSLPEKLVVELVAGATVPHKIRNNLTAAAQYIENFKHRKTLTCLMAKAFAIDAEPSAFHAWIAAQTVPWNADDLAAAVPAARPAWPGSAVNSAKRAVGIAPVPVFRRSHRGEGSRKNSPLITWRTTLRPTPEEKNA